MKKFICLLLFICLFSPLKAEENNITVVCVHGFLRTKYSMHFMARALRAKGYRVILWGYPTHKKHIAEHGLDLKHFLINYDKEHPNTEFCFVTHSLGGLVVRSALSSNPPLRCTKAILLAPPNRGSAFGRLVGKIPLARSLVGRASGGELMTQYNFDYLGQFPSTIKLLIIAGTSGKSKLIELPHDGKVTLMETHLPSANYEHKAHSANHTFIMNNPKVQDDTIDFLNR